MNEVKPYVIGVDLGGTNTVFGIVNQRGDVLYDDSIRTQEYATAEAFVEAGVACLKPLIDKAGGIDQIKAMGIGAPNGNYYTGAIEFAPNLPWKGVVPLAKMFSDALNIPVAMTNDANAAALGEMIYGVARGMKNFIVITLGTGVGSGIVIDGKLLYGHDGFAGELGHCKVDHSGNGRLCGCGQKGCIEAYASATGVARTAKEIVTSTTQPTLLRQVADIDHITSKDVFDAAEKGDLVAKEIFDYTGHLLGEKLADYVHFSSPEAIILFGGLTKSGHWIMDPIREALDANLMPIWKGKIPVSISVLKDSDAAILGASSLAW